MGNIALGMNEGDNTFPKVERILYSINTWVFHKSLIECGEGSKKDDCVDYFN